MEVRLLSLCIDRHDCWRIRPGHESGIPLSSLPLHRPLSRLRYLSPRKQELLRYILSYDEQWRRGW